MYTNKRLLILLTTLLLLPLHTVQAGDAASFNFIGFSENGQYLAFEQYGIADGSGAAYSEIFFVDVPKNDYAGKPVRMAAEGEKEDLASIRRQNRAEAQAQLNDLKITGLETGTQVIAHTLYDIGADPHSVRFTPEIPAGPVVSASYQILLQEQAAAADCFGFGKARMFSLKLIDENTKKETILQQDSRLPNSRGCVFNYRIQDVYLFQNKHVAVFLNIFMPGFEGKNVRYLAVTGGL